MDEEIFFASNNFLNSVISDRYENQQKGASKRKLELGDFYIFTAAIEITNSNGIIETDNEDIRNNNMLLKYKSVCFFR